MIFINGKNPASFYLIYSFSQHNEKLTIKSVDGVLGIRTLDRRVVGAVDSTFCVFCTTNFAFDVQYLF